MQFLKILFWCLLAFVAATFTTSNWFSVPVRLPGGLVAETNLPMLLLVAYLLGLVPTAIYQHLQRWRLRQRLAVTERQLAELRAVAIPTPQRVAEPELEPAPPATERPA